jgi:multiple sugar transport system substrate-binding protein
MKNKGLIIVLLLAGTVAVLPVYSGGARQGQAGSSGTTAELRFPWWEIEANFKIMQDNINNFQATHPNVKIILEQTPYNEFFQKLPVQVASGTQPEIMILGSGMVQRYAEMGALTSLNSYVKSDVTGRIYDAHRVMATYKDSLYALPLTLTTVAVFYNKTMARAAGVNPPTDINNAWTMEQIFDAAAKMQKAANAPYGIYIGSREFWYLPFFLSNGVQVLNKDNTGPAINTPKAVEVLTFLRKQVEAEVLASPSDSSSSDLFPAGLMPMRTDGHWLIAEFNEKIKDFDYGVTYLPQSQNQKSVAIGGDFMAVSAATPYKQEAADFISYITSGDVNAAYIKAKTYLSPDKNAVISYDHHADLMELFKKQAVESSAEFTLQRALPVWDKFLPILNSEIFSVLDGVKQPQEALKVIEDRINQAFKE